ncbi:GNAT family N-acetyltransferase [bacterium]|nr:GNAT family N-acetyltransferase [bacterium]
MVEITSLVTNRLVLRQWMKSDYQSFSKLNADPEVMEFFPDIYTESQSVAFINKTEELITKRGWGFWAVELKADHRFIGFVGLHKPEADLPFTPCVEIGWRLDKQYWGQGFATEAGNAALEFAFKKLLIDEVVSFTSQHNEKSKAVMERLNLIDTEENFEHPNIAEGHHLRQHVLYKITKEHWEKCTHLN